MTNRRENDNIIIVMINRSKGRARAREKKRSYKHVNNRADGNSENEKRRFTFLVCLVHYLCQIRGAQHTYETRKLELSSGETTPPSCLTYIHLRHAAANSRLGGVVVVEVEG